MCLFLEFQFFTLTKVINDIMMLFISSFSESYVVHYTICQYHSLLFSACVNLSNHRQHCTESSWNDIEVIHCHLQTTASLLKELTYSSLLCGFFPLCFCLQILSLPYWINKLVFSWHQPCAICQVCGWHCYSGSLCCNYWSG